ncbi:MAG: hemerythrin domain-containing protein [Parafilimonas sp.]
MEENKPIKRSEALKELSKDHHFNLLLTWKIKQGLQLNVELMRIQKFIKHFFNEQILHHFSVEESHLFCLLPQDDAQRLRAENEHSSIKEIGAEISANTISADKITEFANLLESHIRFEERTLFPFIEKNVLYNKLEEASKHFSAEHEEGWHDAFWIKEK